MSIVFPLVPNVLGVPPVSRKVSIAIAVASLVARDILSSLTSVPVRWGIFFEGEIALEADSAVAVDYKKEWHIADYPIEKGNFESYNKVRIPFDVRVTLSKGGSEFDRSEFLASLEQIAETTNLYDVVTPEYVYKDVNIIRFDYRRTALNGVSLLIVDVVLQEVRNKVTTTFAKTDQPAGAPQTNDGVVQTKEVPGVPAATAPASTLPSSDNLPGFSKPLVDYTALGFQ